MYCTHVNIGLISYQFDYYFNCCLFLFFVQTVSELNAERQELSEAFKRIKKERDTAEKELDQCREEKDKLENLYTDKIKESNDLVEVGVKALM